MSSAKFEDFMDLYDNWNGVTRVNDNELNPIIEMNTAMLMSLRENQNLFEKEVVTFGFYDGVLTVRVK